MTFINCSRAVVPWHVFGVARCRTAVAAFLSSFTKDLPADEIAAQQSKLLLTNFFSYCAERLAGVPSLLVPVFAIVH